MASAVVAEVVQPILHRRKRWELWRSGRCWSDVITSSLGNRIGGGGGGAGMGGAVFVKSGHQS